MKAINRRKRGRRIIEEGKKEEKKEDRKEGRREMG